MNANVVNKTSVRVGLFFITLPGFVYLLALCNSSYKGLYAKSSQEIKPKAVFTELAHSFGTIKRGERVVHSFIIRNQGSGDLIIKNVVPG